MIALVHSLSQNLGQLVCLFLLEENLCVWYVCDVCVCVCGMCVM